MKIKRFFATLFITLVFVLVGWAAFVHPDKLMQIGFCTFVSGYFLILICLTPIGGISLGDPKQALNFKNWLAKLLLGQVGLLVITLAALVAFLSHGPNFATLSYGDFSSKLLSPEWGIFPWGIYGLWAIIIAYVTYVKGGVPFLYSIARAYCPKKLEPTVKTFIEASANGGTLIALTLTACSIILLLIYPVESLLGVDHFKTPLITIGIFFLLTPFYFFRLGKRNAIFKTAQSFGFATLRKFAIGIFVIAIWMSFFVPSQSYVFIVILLYCIIAYLLSLLGNKLYRKFTLYSPNLSIYYLFIMIFISLLFVISCFSMQWFIDKYPNLHQLQCQHCGNYFANVSIEARLQSLYWGWWVIWTPLVGAYLAHISIGRTIREFVIGFFALPGAIFIIYLLAGGTLVKFIEETISHLPSGFGYITLALLSAIVFYKMTSPFKNMGYFYSGIMPVRENIPQDRLHLKNPSKTSGLSKTTQKLFISIVGTIFLHTMAGWYGVQIQVLAMAVLIINAVYFGFNYLLLQFYMDRVWQTKRVIPLYEDIH